MNRSSALMALALEAGGLLLFWACDALGYSRYAPMAVLAFVLGDGLRRWGAGVGFPRVWRLFNGLALALATLDLASRGQSWAPYESIAVNALIAIMFAIGAMSVKPLVQEIAEQRQGAPFPPDRQDLRMFFQAYTWVWALYFSARAIAWAWMMYTLPAQRAHFLQTMIGPISLFVMIAISFRGQALFRSLNRLGVFRA